MIIIQLKGGLGNQLFQYAAGMSLAKHHQVPLKVDITELKHADKKIGTVRHYELLHLTAPPDIASPAKIKSIIKQGFIKKWRQRFLPSYQRIIYNEKKFSFDPDFFNAGTQIYLKGYRQSEKYFNCFKDDVRNAFQFKNSLIKDVSGFAEKLSESTSVAVHIRRGDYTTSSVQSYHGSVPLSYYREAIEKLTARLAKPFFYIFSDDINWAKDTLQSNEEMYFISQNDSKNQYEDFFLMSRCKHNIIANSSFSWWAAWLNPNPEKIVIAPKKWFNNPSVDTSDLIPNSWLCM